MRAPLIISLLLSLFTTYVTADITIRYDSISPQQKKVLSTVLLKENLVRISNKARNQPDVMLDLSSGDIVQMHSESKSYFKINARTINQYVSLYRQNKGLMQTLISQGAKQLSPQKQHQIQQMMDTFDQKSASPLSLKLKKTAKRDQVLGVQCRIYMMIEQDRRIADVCLADYKQLELAPADIQSFEKLKQLMYQFKQSAPEQQDILGVITQGLEQMEGVPMKIVDYYADGKIRKIIQADSISLRRVPQAAYQIPQGYQQKMTPLL